MAVLELITFHLIEPNLAINDPTCGVGRVWNAALNYVSGKPGLIKLYWGKRRDKKDLIEVVLVWKDMNAKDDFHGKGKALTTFNVYLKRPMQFRHVRCFDSDSLISSEENILIIFQLLKDEENLELENHGPAPPNAVRFMSGDFYRTEINHDPKIWSNLIDHLEERTKIAFSSNTGQILYPTSAFQILEEIILSHEICPKLHEVPSEYVHGSQLADLLDRKFHYNLSPNLPPYVPKTEIDGPECGGSTAYRMYRYGDGVSFEGGSTEPIPGPSTDIVPIVDDGHYFETISFDFQQEVTNKALKEEASPLACSWRDFCETFIYGKILKSHIVRPVKPSAKAEMFLEFVDADAANVFHGSEKVIEVTANLSKHLNTDAACRRSKGVAFRPRNYQSVLEVINLVISASSSTQEKRALGLYVKSLHKLWEGWKTSLQYDTETLYLDEWVQLNDSEIAYRIRASWDDEPQQNEWIRRLTEQSPYSSGAFRAHLVALCVDRIEARTVCVMPTFHFQHSDSGSDLGWDVDPDQQFQ